MIVVTTPTGKIGSQLLPLLIAAGETVRVISRHPAKLPPEVFGKVEIFQGSTDDPVILHEAMRGAEALFWVLPPPWNADNLNNYCLRFMRPAAQAIKEQGVERVVAVSSLGRTFGRDAGLASLLHTMDEAIKSTGVRYRPLWCPGFMENTLQQMESIRRQNIFYLPVEPDVKTPLVAVRDVAAVAAKLLLDTSWTGQDGEAVLGPEDLSQNDVANILSSVLGHPVRYQQTDGKEYARRLTSSGASEAMAQGYIAMCAAISEGLYGAVSRTADNTTPTGFRQWAEATFKPAD